MARTKMSNNPEPSTSRSHQASRTTCKRKAASPDSPQDYEATPGAGSLVSPHSLAGYPSRATFEAAMAEVLNEKDKKVLTRAQIAEAARLLANPDELRRQPNKAYRKWVTGHLVLDCPQYGAGVAYMNRGLLVPCEDLYDVLLDAHRSKSDGHAGRDKTSAAIQDANKWCLKALVELFIKLCPHCVDRKEVNKRIKTSFGSGSDVGLRISAFPSAPVGLSPCAVAPGHAASTSNGSISSTIKSPCGAYPGAVLPQTPVYAPVPGVHAPSHPRQASSSGSVHSDSSYASTTPGATPPFAVPGTPTAEPVFCMPQAYGPAALGLPTVVDKPYKFGRGASHGFLGHQAPDSNLTLGLPEVDVSPSHTLCRLLALDRDRPAPLSAFGRRQRDLSHDADSPSGPVDGTWATPDAYTGLPNPSTGWTSPSPLGVAHDSSFALGPPSNHSLPGEPSSPPAHQLGPSSGATASPAGQGAFWNWVMDPADYPGAPVLPW